MVNGGRHLAARRNSMINYRAWNKNDKKMYYAEYGKHCFVTNTEWWAIGDPDTEDYVATSVNSELMMSTGIRDKNGVLIYEGDLVRVNGGRVFRVVFFTDVSAFGLKNDVIGYTFISMTTKEKEIVGHIYDGETHE